MLWSDVFSFFQTHCNKDRVLQMQVFNYIYDIIQVDLFNVNWKRTCFTTCNSGIFCLLLSNKIFSIYEFYHNLNNDVKMAYI